MTPREAENLLGGYATGTLSEAERKALFAAALEDQSLFDALADEEALRELLADPAARAKLIAALEKPASNVRPLWRRPGAMTLAASLLAAVGVGILLKHTNAPQITPMLQKVEPQTEAAPAAPAPKPSSLALAPEAAPLRRAKKAPAPPPPPPPPPSEATQVWSVAGGAAKANNYDVGQAAKTEGSLSNQPAAPAPAAKDADQRTRDSLGAGVGAFNNAFKQAKPAPAPTWSWDNDEAGHRRLTVSWGPGGFLYLIERNSTGAILLTPTSTATVGGQNRSIYLIADEAAPLDLYWLSAAAATPEQLPAAGPVTGFRVRVWPTEKKNP